MIPRIFVALFAILKSDVEACLLIMNLSRVTFRTELDKSWHQKKDFEKHRCLRSEPLFIVFVTDSNT